MIKPEKKHRNATLLECLSNESPPQYPPFRMLLRLLISLCACASVSQAANFEIEGSESTIYFTNDKAKAAAEEGNPEASMSYSSQTQMLTINKNLVLENKLLIAGEGVKLLNFHHHPFIVCSRQEYSKT